MKVLTLAFFVLGVVVNSYGQPIIVPRKMKFADIKLTIREGARKEIQKDVDALTKSPHYFNIKVERAKSYFPIIEKIFIEEHLPIDFKFLVLQESALISDAVSTSNAVGYWQFKDFTAEEVGLRVDKEIDERMNLESSTRGAARYLKQNNFHFNNWLCALQAYQMGAGGAKRVLGDQYNGAKHMEITSKTYWYVKKFLAHKIAFEKMTKGKPEIPLTLHKIHSKTSLKKITNELSVELTELKEYNKWVRTGTIPGDKQYAVLIPLKNSSVKVQSVTKTALDPVDKQQQFTTQTTTGIILSINQIRVTRAQSGESLTEIANRVGTKLSSFLQYNDISIDHDVVSEMLYFTAKKKNRASKSFHSVAEGESIWKISQLYGVRMKRLKKYNNLLDGVEPSPNTTLWLSDINPNKQSNSNSESIVELDETQLFDWNEMQLESSE